MPTVQERQAQRNQTLPSLGEKTQLSLSHLWHIHAMQGHSGFPPQTSSSVHSFHQGLAKSGSQALFQVSWSFPSKAFQTWAPCPGALWFCLVSRCSQASRVSNLLSLPPRPQGRGCRHTQPRPWLNMGPGDLNSGPSLMPDVQPLSQLASQARNILFRN